MSINDANAPPLENDLHICYVTDPLAVDPRYVTFYIEKHTATLADRQWFCLAQPSNYDADGKPTPGSYDQHTYDKNVQQVRKRVHAMLHRRPVVDLEPDQPVLSPATPADTGRFADCLKDASFKLPCRSSKYETIFVVAPV